VRSWCLNALVLVLGLGLVWGIQQIPAQAPDIPLPPEPAKTPEPLPPPLTLPADPAPLPLAPAPLPLTGSPLPAGPELTPGAAPTAPTTTPRNPTTPDRPPKLRVLVPLDRDDPVLVKPTPDSSAKSTAHSSPVVSGAQLPVVTLEKLGPGSIRAGQPFSYEIVVRNLAAVPATAMRLEDELPPGTRLLSAQPTALHHHDKLTWSLENLAPGAERRFRVEVQPAGAAEWKGQATLTVSVSSGLKATIEGPPLTSPPTSPPLTLLLTGPNRMALGDAATFQLRMTNNSDRAISAVHLRVELSNGLEHLHGSAIEADLGALAPGQTRQVPLEVFATKAGQWPMEATLTTGERQQVVAGADLAVTEPGLMVRQIGSPRLLQGATTEYKIEVANREQSEARGVVLTNALPEGLELVNVSEGGVYQATTRSVQWFLGAIPAGQTRSVSLKVAGKTVGAGVNRLTARIEPGQETRSHTALRVLPAAPRSPVTEAPTPRTRK